MKEQARRAFPQRACSFLLSRLRTLLICAVALPLTLPLIAATPTIELRDGSFIASNLPATAVPEDGWSSIFQVFTATATGDVPPMAGAVSVERDAAGLTLRFRPRFPLARGVAYRAVLRLVGESPVQATFQLPDTTEPAPRVLRIYPTSDTLPANQLRLYIQFSGPMARGSIWDHLHLERANGGAVELPFLEIEQELWDREQRRLTVLFDPGRIKRGVAPQMEMGAVLEPGQRYRLIVNAGMIDAEGRPLSEPFVKEFTASAAVRSRIDPKQWKITAPRQKTKEPVVVDFDRTLDAALVREAIEIRDDAGNRVEGSVQLERAETQWRFVPATPWPQGIYSLRIADNLEDGAGNRIDRPFDGEVSTAAQRGSAERLEFEVR